MLYAVCEIQGKQYIIKPGVVVKVDKLNSDKISVDKVMLLVDDNKIEIGTPYLKESLDFEVVGIDKSKIRVAKFHAKANYRKVRGQKVELSKIKLVGNKDEVKTPKAKVSKKRKKD